MDISSALPYEENQSHRFTPQSVLQPWCRLIARVTLQRGIEHFAAIGHVAAQQPQLLPYSLKATFK
jgi:hypothetical protein